MALPRSELSSGEGALRPKASSIRKHRHIPNELPQLARTLGHFSSPRSPATSDCLGGFRTFAGARSTSGTGLLSAS